MSIDTSLAYKDTAGEVSALIATLIATERRLGELTLGEVDTVTDPDGRTFLLGRAQEQLRESETTRQSAILNALPAHIALLDAEGAIVSVNEAWRRFGDANGLHTPGHAVGVNYVDVCKEAQGEHAIEAHSVAVGVCSVLERGEKSFSLEYPCHSPVEQRWFQLMVTPLAHDCPKGAVVMHVDITERKLSEQTLRASEASMAAAQRIAHFGSWETDLKNPAPPSAGALRWSDEMYRIAGYEPGSIAISNEFFFNLVPSEEREPIRRAAELAIREHGQYSIVHRLLRPNGEVRTVRETAQIIYDGQTGEPLKMFGTAHDITEWRKATDALQASLAEFRTLAESMPQIVWETRADGGNIYLNQRWTDYTGLSLADSAGDGWLKPFHPDDQEGTFKSWQDAVAAGGPYSIESRLRRADGAYRWWLIRGVPLLDANGQIFKWVGTCTDIDDLKQAQDRMSQQAALLDVAQDSILVKDLEDRIIYWNKSAERTYGWTAAEAIGRVSSELFKSDQTAFDEARASFLVRGEWQSEMTHKTKDGRAIIADVRWTLVKDPNGASKSVLAIHTNITEKKKLESQFLRVQRMESIGTLASGIAHDLNNVLAPIMMSVELLKDMVPSGPGQSLLNTLQSCTQRGADLVKQVLSFARGVEGQRVTVNLMHIVRDIQHIIRDTFPKNIAFTLQAPRTAWNVIGDPTQLHQVFMNLCVNSRDAMPLGGRLVISIENVRLDDVYSDMNSEAKPGPYLLIKVEDSGEGIPPAIKDRIFEPFFTTKEVGKGTGLGLSTTLGIVKSHGGFVSLYSEPGKGADFRIYLPASLNAADADPNPSPRNELPMGHGELILVVDDEENIRAITEGTLKRFNYRVLLARNGAEAVGIYARHAAEIALVLTDMAMPVMDGPALIVALRSLNPDVKMIGCSGNASTNGRAKALGSGLLHFIPKPYTAETLIRILAEVLPGKTLPA